MSRLNYTDDVAADLERIGAGADPATFGVVLRLLWAGRLLEDLLERAAVAAGVRRRGDYEVLTVLMRAEDTPPTPAEIAAQLSSSPSGMTSRLDRLQEQGMIERQADPVDRRLLRIGLTESGRQVAEEALSLAGATYESVLEPLSDEDRATLNSNLRIVLERLDQLGSKRAPWNEA